MERREVIPLSQRKIDIFFIVIFSVFTVTSVLYAPISALDIRISEDSSSPILRWMHGVASKTDTLVIQNPQWARFCNGIDAYFNSWFQILLIYCIVKGREWIRIPYFYYHAIHLYGTLLYTWMAYYGEKPVPDIAAVIGMNAPYAIFPALFLFTRMLNSHPFTRSVEKKRS